MVSLLALLVAFLAGAKRLRSFLVRRLVRETIPRSEKFVRQDFFVAAEIILDKLNPFHTQLQFTDEFFTDDQDVHFLDIKITPNGTSVYGKSTHTGQYVHLSSFTP